MIGVREKVLAVAQTPWPLVLAWVVGGAVSVIVPATKWKKDRQKYYSYQGRYIEYQQAQRAYEQNNGNNNNNNNNNNGNYDWDCKWFQFQCKQNRYYYRYANQGGGGGGGGGGDRMQLRLPNWYVNLGGKFEGERREREEMGSTNQENDAVKFVYTLSLMMFVGLLIYGVFVFSKRRSPATLMAVTTIFGICALMQMVLIPQGVIPSDDRELENSIYGWYGQLPVLLVYTDWAYFLFCIISIPVIAIYLVVQHRFFGPGSESTAKSLPTTESEKFADGPSSNFTPMA